MTCAQCRREAPADAVFCPECGAKLVHVCVQCGSVNALAHKFCKQCGGRLEAPPAEPAAETRFADPQTYTPRHLAEKILMTRAALEGERKILTVLFTDVSGFTALSERLDPEDVHDLWRVEGTRGRRDRLAAALERGITPLVGRERDLDLLRDRFQEVQAGHGQAVFVVGDPGIGKSRLMLEFRQQAGQGARWLTGRCVSYGRAIPYLPVLDIVRDLFDLEESDEPTALGTKVERGIRGLGAELEWTVPLVRTLLSLDSGDAEVAAMNPHQRRSRIVDALHALVAAESRQRPLAMLIEDLHWIDTHSEEVLRRLLEGIVALPVLVVLTHRPGYSPPFADRTYHTRITLRALPAPQIGAMVEAALGTSAVPAPLLELIAHKADGNPLFIEEISRSLVDRLVVFGATPSARFSLGGTPWRPEVLAHIRAGEYDEALHLFAPRVVSEPGGRDLAENFIESARALPPAVFRNFFLSPPDPGRNVEALLPGISVPTLVLHADEDRLVTLEGAQFLAGQIPGAQLYVFKGRGHAAYNTATAEFAEVVRRFVRTGRPT